MLNHKNAVLLNFIFVVACSFEIDAVLKTAIECLMHLYGYVQQNKEKKKSYANGLKLVSSINIYNKYLLFLLFTSFGLVNARFGLERIEM